MVISGKDLLFAFWRFMENILVDYGVGTVLDGLNASCIPLGMEA